MSDEEEETFTFTWRVRNFSMCPVQLGNYISSPVFRISKFGNSEWELRLYPRGDKTKNSIACFVNCKGLGINKGAINVKLSLCISSYEKTTENTYKLEGSWGYPDFVLVKDILNENAKHLPNDTLTMKCTMKCKNIINMYTSEDDIAETISRKCLCKSNYPNSNQCCIETTIPVETKSVIWTIQRFISLSCNNELVLPVFSPVKEIPSFYVKLYKIADSPTRIQIKRNKNCIAAILYIRCRLSVISTDKDVKYCAEDDFLFKSVDDEWTFPPFLQLGDLEKDGYFESTDGMLHLQFDFAFSIGGRMHNSEKQDWNPVFLPTKSQLPVKLFTESATDDDLSIVTLKAGDHTFKVHRSILESKSEVFHKMFESDMTEKQTGVVDITDVDPHIVAQMLEFIYFNTDEDLSQRDAVKLYAFGDKYQVKSLVSHCSSVLASLLSVSNVCDILDLADLHQDLRLLKYAQDFVAINSDSILVSKEWEEFMERSGTLAAKVLHKILIK